MKITKADLINKVYATNPNLTKVKAYDAVETVLQLIKNGLENGNDVLLSGFGKFLSEINQKEGEGTLKLERY